MLRASRTFRLLARYPNFPSFPRLLNHMSGIRRAGPRGNTLRRGRRQSISGSTTTRTVVVLLTDDAETATALLLLPATTLDAVVALATGFFRVLADGLVGAFLAVDGAVCAGGLCGVAFDLGGKGACKRRGCMDPRVWCMNSE